MTSMHVGWRMDSKDATMYKWRLCMWGGGMDSKDAAMYKAVLYVVLKIP